MATTDTDIQSEARTIAIDRVRVPNNVRALDQAHVDALAGSIRAARPDRAGDPPP